MQTPDYVVGGSWVIASVAAGFGATMMGPTPEDFAVARACFQVAAGVMALGAVVYLYTTDARPLVRVLVGGGSFLVLAFGLNFGLGLIKNKQQEIASQAPVSPKPDLHAQLIRENGGAIGTDENSAVPWIAPTFAIANTGTMSSPVTDYSATVTIAGQQYLGSLIYSKDFYVSLANEISPSSPDSDPTKYFMYNITKKSIGIGDKVIGYIGFSFPKLSAHSIMPGANFSISFHDILGKRYVMEWTDHGHPPHRPGQTYVPSIDPMR